MRSHESLTGSGNSRELVKEPVTKDKPQRRNAVFPPDLFALRVIAAGIVDAGLVETIPATGQLRGQLRLEAEPVGGQLHAFDALPPENFVAGFHVGEVEIAEQVREQREKPVG